jgi:hypothetical protein
MRFYGRVTWLAVLSLVLASGCTSAELRRESISQLSTVHDLQQQQVLDNLAMFVCNRNSYPYFSTIGAGSCTVTDMGSVGNTNSWGRSAAGLFLYNSLGLNPTVSRSVGENWQLNPINDAVRLTLMRCVYQKAVACCFNERESAYCPDCNALYNAFYGNVERPVITSVSPTTITDPHAPIYIYGEHLRGALVTIGGVPAVPPPTPASGASPYPPNDDSRVIVMPVQHPAKDPLPPNAPPGTKETVTLLLTTAAGAADPVQVAWYVAGAAAGGNQGGGGQPAMAAHAPGMITPQCATFCPRWFCCGHKCHVPKDCPCRFTGHYCDTYVWIPPEHVNELTQLTILIQDIAYYDFSTAPIAGGATVPARLTGALGRAIAPQPPNYVGAATTLYSIVPPPPAPGH